MATQNVTGQSQQVADINKYNVPINENKDDHQMNTDLAVQMVFLQYNDFMNLRTQDKLDQVKATLAEMSACRDMYSRMKELKNKAGGGTSEMPQDMVDFLDARGIQWDHTGNDHDHDKDEWDINMQYLDSYMQKISGQNKTQMLELNQCVEDGNNALREVSTEFSKYSEMIQAIIQNLGR